MDQVVKIADNQEKPSAIPQIPQKVIMKELPKQDRPVERCLSKGPQYLTDAQLLAEEKMQFNWQRQSLTVKQKTVVFLS